MITKINQVQQNPNFGWIKLPAKDTNGYKALIQRLKRNEMTQLDKLVEKYSDNPIEVAFGGFDNTLRISAEIRLDKFREGLKKVSDEEIPGTQFFRSPLNFIERTAKKADKMWQKIITEEADTESKTKILDTIIEKSKKQ